jgi:PST family polysaccharide transporter
MKFDRMAAVRITASLLSVIVAVLMALRGLGYWALVGREVSRNMFLAVGAWVCFPWLPGAPSRQVGVGRMLRFGAGITGFNLTYLVSMSLDQVLIGKIFGAHPLGIYRQGIQLVLTPMDQLTYPVRVVAESALSRLQHDADRYRLYFRKILSTLSLATFPLGLFVAVYAREVVLVVLGERWIEVTPIVSILAASALMQPAVTLSGAVMVTCGQSRKFFWLGLVSSATLVAFFLIGIPFGIAGIASAHVWSLWLLLVPRLYLSFKGTPISIGTFFSAISRPAANGAVMMATLLILRRITVVDGHAALLGLGMVVALIAYFGAWLAFPGGRAELKSIVVDLSGPEGLSQLLPRRLRPATRVPEQGL